MSTVCVVCEQELQAEQHDEIKSRTGVANAAINKNKTFITIKFDINLRKKPEKCYTWNRALYSAETWIFQNRDQKYLESF